MRNKTLIIILGPTAAGKTKTSIEIAKRINGEIISADSMQVYRGMDIGTAKPAIEERQSIPHHLIDIKEPNEPFTVSDFVKEAQRSISKIKDQGKTPIIVGGTGLYLWTLLEGYSFPIAPADQEIRKRLEKLPLSTLFSRLSTADPEAAKRIHPNDKKRIVRALEVYELTGKPISKLQKKKKPGKSPLTPSKVEALRARQEDIIIGLTLPREELYQRIEERVDQMIEKGLIEEVKGLLTKGFSKDIPSFQALGYKEVVEYLNGKWSKEEMIKELKKRTRHFARRQLTWFRRFKEVKWFDASKSLDRFAVDTRSILDYINSV